MDFLGVDIRTIVLSITTVINLILGSLIYLRSKEKSSFFFVVAVFSVAIWSIGLTLYIQSGVNDFTYMWSNINYLITAITSVAFFFFAVYFGREHVIIPTWFVVFTLTFMILVIAMILSPGMEERLVVSHIGELEGGIKQESFGIGYPIYVAFIGLYFLGGLVLFIDKFIKTSGIVRNQLKYILLGTGFAIVMGITLNVVFPNIGYFGYEAYGPIGTLIMVILISYAITKHHLWDFKLIAVQIFTALIILTMLLQIFVSEGTVDRAIKGIIFTVILVFSYYLIRGMLLDVAVREEMENLALELAQANKRLREVDIEKSDFVSITSHQFRTPLTVIKGYASMLMEGSFGTVRNKELEGVIDKIYRASQRLVHTIEAFLNISRIEKNEMVYNYKKIDLKVLVGSIVREFEKTFKEQNLKFSYNASLKEDYFVKCDIVKTRQVLSNILDNSIKYTMPGGGVAVELERNKKDGIITFKVIDTGIGITPGMMPRLFEKFSRAEGTSKLHTEGRGLGLYISKQIMTAQNGRIWAESEGEGRGSTFIVEFPDFEYEKKRKEVNTFLKEL